MKFNWNFSHDGHGFLSLGQWCVLPLWLKDRLVCLKKKNDELKQSVIFMSCVVTCTLMLSCWSHLKNVINVVYRYQLITTVVKNHFTE